MAKNPIHAGSARIWVIEGGVGPNRSPTYMGRAAIGTSSFNFGEATKVEEPDPTAYDQFIEVDSIAGAQERPTTSIRTRYSSDLSDLLRLARKKCRLDLHVHLGKCRDPQDFNGGWEKIRVYPDGKISTWADENSSAMESGDNASATEQVDLSARDIYEIGWLEFSQVGAAQSVREVLDMVICDQLSCGGECGNASDGYNKVFGLIAPLVGSVGASPRVVFSSDGFATADWDDVSTLTNSSTATTILCIGSNIVVVSDSGLSLSYTNRELLLAGAPVWVQSTTGFVAARGGTCGVVADARHTWIGGKAGYIYFTSDPSAGVTVASSGSLTNQDINKMAAYDDENVVAVGNLNAVLFTRDGVNWSFVTGPASGVNLTAVACIGRGVWIVGCSNGAVYSTETYGSTWKLHTLPVTMTAIQDIKFVDETVGYLIGSASTRGYMFRTVCGGNSWYALPERVGASVPLNDKMDNLAVARGVHNLVFAGGLADNGTSGFIVKGA